MTYKYSEYSNIQVGGFPTYTSRVLGAPLPNIFSLLTHSVFLSTFEALSTVALPQRIQIYTLRVLVAVVFGIPGCAFVVVFAVASVSYGSVLGA